MEIFEKLKTGTTTLGIICKNGIVIAAEKKSTMGYLVASKETEKIIKLNDRIVMTTAGSVGDNLTLARWLRAEIKLFEIQNNRKISVRGVATLLSNILNSYRFFPFFVQILIAGYDEYEGFKMYSFDMLGGMEEEKKFFATGSGSPMALGVLEALYKENLDIKEAKDIAIKAIKAAIERDIGSGGKGIDIAIITEKGIQIETIQI
ncbi:MAG: archaeal proteasome endopeptidase complex subunit beta [Candidatus Aenigmatarchaeota archaeon]|nr:archaeal proteasome endopeptidase complex subunit beta [Candidatus Aenigmarchaeota archaeon]